jgi:hypothetical protein
MNKKQRKTITRLLVLQIDSHVDGDTRLSNKVLKQHEMFLSLGEIISSIQNITNTLKQNQL